MGYELNPGLGALKHASKSPGCVMSMGVAEKSAEARARNIEILIDYICNGDDNVRRGM